MPSIIDVCNLALDRLGEEPIFSFTDNETTAPLCQRIYTTSRDEVQRAHPWRRLKKRAQIAADVTAPVWGYDYKYPIPADCQRLLDVYKDTNKIAQWELEGNDIHTNESGPLNIRYIKFSDDPNEWDSLMVSAVAARMAMDMAERITQSPGKRDRAEKEYMLIMRQARRVNAQEGLPQKFNDPDSWESVRFQGTSALGEPYIGPVV